MKSLNVSIPFKREGVSKVIAFLIALLIAIIGFQFPSNGKVYPKILGKMFTTPGGRIVSIPFKREGVSKAHLRSGVRHFATSVSIPFKREGVSKVIADNSPDGDRFVFQFPSNGKVYPKVM